MGGGEVATSFITLQFNYIYCMWVGKVKFPLLCFDSLVLWMNHATFSSKFYSTKTVYHLEYTEKYMDNFLSTKGRCFLIFKKGFGEDKWRVNLNELPYCFFLHIFEVKVPNIYWPITWEI